MALPPILNKQVGPFKLWIWGALVGAGVGAGILWRTFGSTETVEKDAAEPAPPPVIATEPVGYVYTEEDGTARLDRPNYDSVPAPQQAPQPGTQVPPSTIPQPGMPQVPDKGNVPAPTPAPQTNKPTPVTGLKASVLGTKVNVSWNGNDQAHRVVVNDTNVTPETNLFVSPYGAQSGEFEGKAGKLYKIVAYKQLKPLVNSAPTAPVSIMIPENARGSGATNPSDNNTTKYPGLANGFVMDCATADTHHNVRTIKEIDVQGLSTTLRARKVTAWALCNTGSPSFPSYAVVYWTGTSQAAVRAASNKDRVRWGLYPLTDAEWDQVTALQKQMLPKGNLDERNAVFQSLQYAQALFDKFNLPYQCGRSMQRSSAKDVTSDIRIRS